MKYFINPLKKDPQIFVSMLILVFISLYILNSFSPDIFPQYYFYVGFSFLAFYIFYAVGFEIIKYFSFHLYVISIVLLVLTLVIGQVTRGAIRWIPIGNFAFQASEVVRPFIILYFAKLVSEYKGGVRNLLIIAATGLIPVVLIAIQPSFGVSVITLIGLIFIFFIKILNRKNILILLLVVLLSIPGAWFTLKPYQKERITGFFNYETDPRGTGYNAIQSIISVGSGGILGRGFKKGFQTQLEYLPEKHTDFVFAGISEEIGFIGAFSVLTLLYLIYFRMFRFAFKSKDEVYRYFAIGLVIIFLVETIINVGMNLGILPITGLPLPLVSAGGSSMLSSLISISLILSGI